MTIQDPQKEDELRSAVFRADVESVKGLLVAGLEPNAHDQEGNTPLIEATQAPCLEIVRLLLDAGADIEGGDHESSTPLMWAIRSTLDENYDQAVAVVKLLIERGADVNARTDSGAPPLIYAVIQDEPEVVRMLLDAGADPNVVTNAGWTALDYANEYGLISCETKALLLAAGAVAKRESPCGPSL